METILPVLIVMSPVLLYYIVRFFLRGKIQAELEQREQFRRRMAEYERAGWQIKRGSMVSGEHAGVRFEHYAVSAGKYSPARSQVSIATALPGEFDVGAETGDAKVVKQLGMVDEFQSGDASIDASYYFSGTTDEYVRAVFGNRENLELVRAVFAHGFKDLEKRRTRLVATRPGEDWIGIAELKSIVELLSRFRLPSNVPGLEGKRFVGKQALYALRAAMAVLVAVGIAGFFMTKPLLEGWIEFALGVLPIVSLLCVAVVAAAFVGLKGRSMAAAGLVELLVWLPVMALAFVWTLALANQEFDSTSAEEYEVLLVKRYLTHGGRNKQSVHHHLEFESWRRPFRRAFEVPAATYDLGRVGQVWSLRIRRGWLGYSWLESMEQRT